MRRTRIFTIVLFVIAIAAFAVSQVMQMMTDKSGPTISMDADSITVSAEASEKELLQGVTAQDNTDGDVSKNLMIENMSNLMDGNTRTMTIVAFDSDGNVTKAQRSVTYNDYHAPQFTLDGPLQYALGADDILDNIGATDQLDGNLSASVKITDKYRIPNDTEGEYPLEFTVTNSAGDVARLTATVTMLSQSDYNSSAKIGLSKYIIYLGKGEKLEDPMSYVKDIEIGDTTYTKQENGSFTAASTAATGQTQTVLPANSVSVSGEVDNKKAGTYELTYTMQEKTGRTGSTRLIVVVTE